MNFEIDQSGKIEDTAKDTILCLSNDEWYAVRIPAMVKRQLQERFRRNGQIRNFVLFTFCAGLARLLRVVKPKTKVVIDREYFGKEPVIKNVLERMLADLMPMPVFDFRFIGKHSRAHSHANDVAVGKEKPTKILNEIGLLRQIKKTEVGKRLKDA